MVKDCATMEAHYATSNNHTKYALPVPPPPPNILTVPHIAVVWK